MPKFTVEAQCQHAPAQAYDKIKNFLQNDADLRRLDSKYSCDFQDQTLSGTAKSSQFTANMKVEPTGAGSKVAITVDLPFALSLFKGKIQQVLQKKLDATLS